MPDYVVKPLGPDACDAFFERAGFEYARPKGMKNCVMRKVLPAATAERVAKQRRRRGSAAAAGTRS